MKRRYLWVSKENEKEVELKGFSLKRHGVYTVENQYVKKYVNSSRYVFMVLICFLSLIKAVVKDCLSGINTSELDGTIGFVINGIDAADNSGWYVRNTGDINEYIINKNTWNIKDIYPFFMLCLMLAQAFLK